jgi:hypothetical protein
MVDRKQMVIRSNPSQEFIIAWNCKYVRLQISSSSSGSGGGGGGGGGCSSSSSLLGRTYYSSRSTDFVYVKIVRHNLKVLHHHHVYDCWLINNIYCRYVYGLPAYQISQAQLQWFISYVHQTYEDVSESFRTGRLERELQVVQLSATRCSCIAILWVSLVSFVSITLCAASQRVFIVLV